MREVYLHADDYGLTPASNSDIVACFLKGHLTSLSMLANMPGFEDGRRLLATLPHFPLLSVHLNIIEGPCLEQPQRIGLLVDKRGLFANSCLSLVTKAALYPQQFKEQVKLEFRAQIEKVKALMPPGRALRIDSHVHLHMWPPLFLALLEVIRENCYPVEYIRFVGEPGRAFLENIKLWSTYKPINVGKNLILNSCAAIDAQLLKLASKDLSINNSTDVFGVMLSGNMNLERVQSLLPALRRHSQASKRHLEIFLHPGRMLAEELSADFNKPSFVAFHLSNNRSQEKQTSLELEL